VRPKRENRPSRRDLVRLGLRYAILAGLGIGAAVLAARSAGSGGGEGVCGETGRCRSCPAFAGCRLPERRLAEQRRPS
jgi:hypothetical protein